MNQPDVALSRGVQVCSLYVGSRDGGAFPEEDRQVVTNTVAACFDCFTIIDAGGHYQGCSVATFIVKIATEDKPLLLKVIRGLGHLLEQQAVGLEIAGRYMSISMD